MRTTFRGHIDCGFKAVFLACGYLSFRGHIDCGFEAVFGLCVPRSAAKEFVHLRRLLSLLHYGVIPYYYTY